MMKLIEVIICGVLLVCKVAKIMMLYRLHQYEY
jgi:hypothetical protein